MSADLRVTRTPAALVMSATVRPPAGCPALKRIDPDVRLEDYRRALVYYMSLPSELIDRILFVDNSGSDLSCLEEAVRVNSGSKQVELISFQGNDHPPHFGKGFGEFRLLDHGLQASRLLAPADVLWKVTGRLQVANLPQLIMSAPRAYQVYCDLRSIPLLGDRLGGNHWMELRVFSCTLAAYDRHFRGRYRYLRARNGETPEQHLYKVMRRAGKAERIVPRFRIQPRFVGRSGYSDRDYQDPGYVRKERIRRVARVIAPWLWL